MKQKPHDNLIELLMTALHEIREIADGESDIDKHGGPNATMRILTIADAALGTAMCHD